MFQDLWEEINSKETFEKGCLSVIEKYVPDVKIYTPNNDGVDHINIYSRGKTELGRLLSNFAYSIFEHPRFGKFYSVEAYWYYLKTGCQYYHELSRLYGAKAKATGKKYEVVGCPDFDFEIELALWCKVMQNPHVKEQLKASTLALTHYYYYGSPENPAIRRVKDEKLQMVFEKIRKYLNRARSIKKTLVIIDSTFTDYKFMKDPSMGGMRFHTRAAGEDVTYVRAGPAKFSDEPCFVLETGETFIASATRQEIFELSLSHNKVIYIGGVRGQDHEFIKQSIEIVQEVTTVIRS